MGDGKIGLDFGTTYSVISKEIDDLSGNIQVKSCNLLEGSNTDIWDSLVVKDRESGALRFGIAARNKLGRRSFDAYSGFKMMLSENDSEILKSHFYDEDYSPEFIVSEYLNDLLQKYLDSTGQTSIEKLVVGVPEIWYTDTRETNSRDILKSILEGFGFIENVEVVSEPAAACVYFTQNYFHSTGEKYNGKILIVDYGGGTLDIALCDVKQNGDTNEVKVLARAGAGWNEQNMIGKAGMAFMEEIVRIALINGGVDEGTIEPDNRFASCVKNIETELMTNGNNIYTIYRMHDISDFSSLENIITEFTTIEYKDKDYSVTYGMLAQAYNKVIYTLLNEKIDEILSFMDVNNIDYRSGRNGDELFRIALVGGFCNFCLTERQIKEKLNITTGDNRFNDIITDRRDCEKAISYGAALIANEIGDFKKVAPYSLGIISEIYPDTPYFAINKGDDIEYDKTYMILGNDAKALLFEGSAINKIAINFNSAPDKWEARVLLEQYKNKLDLEKGKVYKFGFSFSQSMAISFHKWTVDNLDNTDENADEEVIMLDEIHSLISI